MKANDADVFIYELVSIIGDNVKLEIIRLGDTRAEGIPTTCKLDFFNEYFTKIEKESDLYTEVKKNQNKA